MKTDSDGLWFRVTITVAAFVFLLIVAYTQYKKIVIANTNCKQSGTLEVATKDESIAFHVQKYSKLRGVDPDIIFAIIHVESGFDQYAIEFDPKGKILSLGLMQINKQVWVDHQWKNNLINLEIINEVSDLYNIRENINAGTFIFKLNKEICKKWEARKRLKYKGYNGVIHCAISKYNGITRYKYYNKVMKILKG